MNHVILFQLPTCDQRHNWRKEKAGCARGQPLPVGHEPRQLRRCKLRESKSFCHRRRLRNLSRIKCHGSVVTVKLFTHDYQFLRYRNDRSDRTMDRMQTG